MKKILLITLMVFGTMTLMAQNQFRDYVDFKQGQQLPPFERPQIERKDGKVIITMSEERFNQMMIQRKMQMSRGFTPIANRHFGHMHKPPFMCEECKRNMDREFKGRGRKPGPPMMMQRKY